MAVTLSENSKSGIMDKMKLPILVVKRKTLFADRFFEGFLPHAHYDFESRILDHVEYLERGKAEEKPNFQQPIPYALVCDTKDRIFTYQRASKKEHSAETRLHGKWSCGVGGHVDRDDASDNPLYASLLREMKEELVLNNFETIEPIGYINDESTPVSRVHFGILYRVVTKEPDTVSLSPEMASGSFLHSDELCQQLRGLDCITEEWTMIALKAMGWFE